MKLAIVGTGGMAHAHARNFSSFKGVRLAACCDVVPGRAREFAAKWAIPSFYQDSHEMLRRESLDAVSVVTPDRAHAPVVTAALARKLHVFCEKPLASTLPEARAMLRAAKRAGVVHMVNFSYRDCPGLAKAADFIRRGVIGRVMHVDASYLQSWLVSSLWGDWRTSPAWGWRLSTRHGSSGVLGDLGSHLFDTLIRLCGDIASIQCRLACFDKKVPGNRVGEYILDANDSFSASVEFRSGALGSVQASRWAVGRLNAVRVAVYGDNGAIEFDLDKGGNEIRIVKGARNIRFGTWRTVKCPRVANNYVRFIRAIRRKKGAQPDFEDGLKVQACLHGSMESDRLGRIVKVV